MGGGGGVSVQNIPALPRYTGLISFVSEKEPRTLFWREDKTLDEPAWPGNTDGFSLGSMSAYAKP